ncbi:MAG: hypothetical protein AAGI53_10240 [Planctomycetota bacterium]
MIRLLPAFPFALVAFAMVLGGCSTWEADLELVSDVDAGQYGRARDKMAVKLASSVSKANASDGAGGSRVDRDFVLDQVRYAMIDLADGQYTAAETPFLAAYDVLRTQGVNDDNTVNTFLGTEEGRRYWKGDPFEQAAAYGYFAAQLASVGDWDNAAAAGQNALFLLQDFSRVIEGERPDEDLTDSERVYAAAEDAQSQAYEDAIGAGKTEDTATRLGREAFDNALDNGYQPIETNFAPGYFMRGLGRWATAVRLGESTFEREARDNFRKAVQYAPSLEPVVDAITSGRANTVLWVDYGKGPEKYRTGYRETISEFRVSLTGTPSTNEPLLASVNGSTADDVGVAADFNAYALDHRWRSNQELRQVKAVIGDVLIYGGIAYAATADTWEEALSGLLVAGIGAIAAESAKADIRHNELLPQRSYFTAVQIDDPDSTIELVISGRPGSRIVLPAIDPPDGREAIQFRYVRLNRLASAPLWATSGRVVWANDYTGSVSGGDLPYLLGGRCVRTPTQDVLDEYQAAGNLRDFTLVDLQNLYREEGLTWDLGDQGGVSRTHVLEGGTSLVAPPPGSAGFVRLFCGSHPSYMPKSVALQSLRSNSEGPVASAN